MPSHDAVLVGQHRVCPSELQHRRRDLRNLRITMRAAVSGVRDKRFDAPIFSLQFLPPPTQYRAHHFRGALPVVCRRGLRILAPLPPSAIFARGLAVVA
jgi:hypothetical protein